MKPSTSTGTDGPASSIVIALIGDQRADTAHFGTGHDDIADLQRAALHQHGCDRTTAAIELGFDHGAFRRTLRIGLQIEQFGLQRDHLEQLVEIGLVLGRHLDVDDVAAERFDLHFVLQQLGTHALGACASGLSILLIATIIGTLAALA